MIKPMMRWKRTVVLCLVAVLILPAFYTNQIVHSNSSPIKPDVTTPDVIIVPTSGGLKGHFPDVTTAANGDILVTYYWASSHAPWEPGSTRYTNRMIRSKDNGLTWEAPTTIADFTSTGHDVVDPNITTLSNGDIITTYRKRTYAGDASFPGQVWYSISHDHGYTWGTHQRVSSILEYGTTGVHKRGDITELGNGDLLMPLYGGESSTKVSIIRSTDGGQTWGNEQIVLNSGGGKVYNEVSLVYANGTTVYMLTREVGTLYRSDDNGATWTLETETEKLHQPGFTRIDSERAFATWADPVSVPGQRPTMGKVFYFDKGWDATETRMIYKSTTTGDMGDPSSTLTADGRLFTVYYDTTKGYIAGTFAEIDTWAYDWVKLTADETILKPGDSTNLHVTGDVVDQVVYTSSDPTIASVTAAGAVRAWKRGEVSIEAEITIGTFTLERKIDLQVFMDPDVVLFEDDFEEYPIGNLGATSKWNTKSGGWSIINSNCACTGKSLKGTTSSGQIHIGKDVNWGDMMLTYQFQYQPSNTGKNGLMTNAYRIANASSYNNMYMMQPIAAGHVASAHVVGTSKYVSGQSTPLNKAYITIDNEQWYSAKVMQQGDHTYIKVWPSAGAEPTEWSIHNNEDDFSEGGLTFFFRPSTLDSSTVNVLIDNVKVMGWSAHAADEAPDWSAGAYITVSDLTTTSVQLSWPAAIDDQGVMGYRILLDDQVIDTVSSTTLSYEVEDLVTSQTYKLSVEAIDASDQSSPALAVGVVTP